MMIRTFALAALAMTVALPAFAQDSGMTQDPKAIQAGTYMLDKSHGKITWSVNHMGFSTYVGQFVDTSAKLTIDPQAPERTLLNATVQTASVATSNEKLDDELKSDSWLNSEKFPAATFEATRVDVTGNKAKVMGNLTLNNVTKPEELDVTFNQAGPSPVDKKYRLGFTGTMDIKRSDFNVTKYLPLVGDDVNLQLEGEFTQGGAE
jgi:polyisoprenoid-binding protein YceI